MQGIMNNEINRRLRCTWEAVVYSWCVVQRVVPF